MTPRVKLSRVARVRIFDRAHGKCHVCGLKIHAERGEAWEAEHIIPLWAGGTDDESNVAPAHASPCHSGKTAAEAIERAKSTRTRANFLGVKKPGPKLPCGRNSNFKKTMRKGVVIRMTQAQMHRQMMARRQIGGSE